MGKIEKILKKGPVEGQTTEVYPVTSTKAVYDENNKRLDNIITGLQESVYLNTPIPISSVNTPKSIAQNVKNIADYVKKAKAAGITDVNGMAVTCIIDSDYSGIGYIYVFGGDIAIQGVLIKDDLVDNMCFSIFNGRYIEKAVIVADNGKAEVVSNMLNKGARRPIIFTLDTTELDEETYQKLLSENVDVILKGEGYLLTLTYKTDTEDYLSLYFTCFSVEGSSAWDSYLCAYKIDITKTSPHTVTIYPNFDNDFAIFLNDSGYLNKSVLNPILQQINLTGTDADRKAKLDQFEADWKALTGASNLDGARFVGYSGEPDNFLGIFTYSSLMGGYLAIATSDSLNTYQVFISPTGIIISNSLFYHLQPITIKTDNTNSDMAYNVAAIQKYVNNLTFLGVYTYDGFTIPVSLTGNEFCGYLICNKYYEGDSLSLSGIVFYNGTVKSIVIDETGRYKEIVDIAGTDPLDRTSNSMLDAINELNTIVNKNAFESITLKAGNTNEDMAANVAAINEYITNLKALKVDTTKGFMVSVNVYIPSSGNYYGYMASNYANGNYFLSGTIFQTNAGKNYVKNVTINPMGRYDEIVSTAS